MKRGPKPSHKSKTHLISFRVNKSEYLKLKFLSRIYTREGLSDYIRMCVFNHTKIGQKKTPESIPEG